MGQFSKQKEKMASSATEATAAEASAADVSARETQARETQATDTLEALRNLPMTQTLVRYSRRSCSRFTGQIPGNQSTKTWSQQGDCVKNKVILSGVSLPRCSRFLESIYQELKAERTGWN